MAINPPSNNTAPEVSVSNEESINQFAGFLIEIQDYFEFITSEKLKWSVENVEITFGHGNVILRFWHSNECYVFKVPKFGQFQIKSQRRAQTFFAETSFFPQVVYFDGKCIIEKFIDGEKLGRDPDCFDYQNLAIALSEIHSQPAEDFGHLIYANVGAEKSSLTYYAERLDMGWSLIAKKGLLKKEIFTRLQKETIERLRKIDNQPKVLCHGDVWRENVIYNPSSGDFKLIDWEGIGAFTKEMDLSFLHRVYVTDQQRAIFFKHYEHEVDMSMIAFYSFLRIVVNFNRQHYSRLTQAVDNFLSYSDQFIIQ